MLLIVNIYELFYHLLHINVEDLWMIVYEIMIKMDLFNGVIYCKCFTKSDYYVHYLNNEMHVI